MPATGIKAVLFDWDDTLISSLPARLKTLETIFFKAGIPGIGVKEFLLGTKGGSLSRALAQLSQEYGIKENLFDSYRRTYWFRLTESIALFPGVKDMLYTLQAAGFKLGISTGKFRDIEFDGGRIGCVQEIRKTGLDGIFSAIIGLEDVKETKPHPECIELALKCIGIEPGDTLVVGDSVADITAAKYAGCKSCHASWGVDGDFHLPEDCKPDFTACVPEDIIQIVKGTG